MVLKQYLFVELQHVYFASYIGINTAYTILSLCIAFENMFQLVVTYSVMNNFLYSLTVFIFAET